MDEVDRYIPDPVRALDKPFAMPVEDVFSIQVRLCGIWLASKPQQCILLPLLGLQVSRLPQSRPCLLAIMHAGCTLWPGHCP